MFSLSSWTVGTCWCHQRENPIWNDSIASQFQTQWTLSSEKIAKLRHCSIMFKELMTKQLSHKLYFWVNCTNLFRHRLFSNYLDELVVLLAGEVGLLGLVILTRDDHRDPSHSTAPTHTHVHCNPGLKIKSWCPMMTHELFVMTSNFLIQETANWQLWHYMLELLSEPKILTWRKNIK